MTRKLRKIAALVLALAMLVSCLALNAFAAGTATGNEAMNVGLALSADTAEPGDEITVTVSISNNYNATTMRWPVLYSTDVFELVDGSLTAAIDSVTSVPGSTTSTTNEEFIPAEYAEGYSAFALQWIANSDGTTIGAFNSATSVACFSFKLKVIEGSEGKTGTVLIPQNSEYFYKMAVSDIADATSFYTAPVTFTVSGATTLAVESAYVAPELVVADGATTVIDTENGFIYGLIDGDSEYGEIDESNISDWLTVEGEGEIEIIGVDGYSNIGTGATINLLDVNGEVVESYKAVIFGDYDGDGYITDFDLIDFGFHCAWMMEDCQTDYFDMTLPEAFAMDVDASGEPDEFDLTIIQFAAAWVENTIDQTYGA